MAKTTLENPLLYRKVLKVLEQNNPDIVKDTDVIDRKLGYDEAFTELKEIYPNLRMAGKTYGCCYC